MIDTRHGDHPEGADCTRSWYRGTPRGLEISDPCCSPVTVLRDELPQLVERMYARAGLPTPLILTKPQTDTDLPAAVAALYEALGRPAPIVQQRPPTEHGYVAVKDWSVRTYEPGVRAWAPDGGPYDLDDGTGRALAAAIVTLLDERAAELGSDEVRDLAEHLHTQVCGDDLPAETCSECMAYAAALLRIQNEERAAS